MSKFYKVSRERIRQIEVRSFEKVKKRFSSLKRQFNKTEKACVKSRTSKAAIKEQEKLGEIFKFLKLSPTQFEIIANPARDALEIIRECEKFIFTVMVKRGKMPRKDFIKDFTGNEANSSWSEKIAKSRKPYAKEVKENIDEIVRLQNKLLKLEKIIQLPITEIKDINRRMSIGEAKTRRAKKDMVEANLRLVISIAKKYTNRGKEGSNVSTVVDEAMTMSHKHGEKDADQQD